VILGAQTSSQETIKLAPVLRTMIPPREGHIEDDAGKNVELRIRTKRRESRPEKTHPPVISF